MTDPRLQSMHLESAPRRDDFRRARSRVQSALGEHTMAGDLRLGKGTSGSDITSIPGSNPHSTCWLLDHGRQIPLKIGLNSVGRLPDNDVVIDDAAVSRRHCAIVVHSDLSIELLDIASKNGTTVNGNKLKGSAKLKDGDEISLCDRKLMFVMRSGAATIDRPKSHHLSDDATMAG